MIMFPVFISDCVCRRPSWKPKTQPNGSSAVVWLSFWFSTRFTRKKLDYSIASYLYALFSGGELRFGLEVSTSRYCASGDKDQPNLLLGGGLKVTRMLLFTGVFSGCWGWYSLLDCSGNFAYWFENWLLSKNPKGSRRPCYYSLYQKRKTSWFWAILAEGDIKPLTSVALQRVFVCM